MDQQLVGDLQDARLALEGLGGHLPVDQVPRFNDLLARTQAAAPGNRIVGSIMRADAIHRPPPARGSVSALAAQIGLYEMETALDGSGTVAHIQAIRVPLEAAAGGGYLDNHTGRIFNAVVDLVRDEHPDQAAQLAGIPTADPSNMSGFSNLTGRQAVEALYLLEEATR